MKITRPVRSALSAGFGITFMIGCLLAISSCDRTSPETKALIPPPTARELLENRLQDTGKILIEAEYTLPADSAGKSLQLTASQLNTHELYLRQNRGDGFIYIHQDGSIESGTPGTVKLPKAVNEDLELMITPDSQILYVDQNVTLNNLSDWTLFWVADQAVRPQLKKTVYPIRDIRDGFMRTKMADENAPWIVTDGAWTMRKHGGGLPETDQAMASYNVPRAVNPFTVTGHGLLTYGAEDWLQGHGEARFYFGTPWGEGSVNTQTLPSAMTLMLAFGDPEGELLSFGWNSRDSAFVLQQRQSGQWESLHRVDGPRPPISNWVRIGLQIRDGHIAEGFVDGAKVLEYDLGRRVRGGFHVRGGVDEIEFDDFHAWTLPKAKVFGEPIFVQSRNFAGKEVKDRSDPAQFSEWAQGSETFVRLIQRTDEYRKAIIVNRIPLMGDFRYETVSEDPDLGELPYGLYELVIYTNPDSNELTLDTLQDQYRLVLMRDERGWHTTNEDIEQWGADNPQPILRLQRLQEENNSISIQIDNQYIPLRRNVSQPVHLAVIRLLPRNATAVFPQAQHHVIHAANLVNEFFEQAPTEWNWIEGGFRMDSRWACQEQWNFMACGGVGVPMMVSKTSYHDDQQHEHYVSLRPVFPSDAGDPDFVFDNHLHRDFFRPNAGWYTRRDLNFSFCMDGRNPLSGYAVIFAGNDNTETLLMRRGEVVARSPRHLPDNRGQHHNIHWEWWNFRVRKRGGNISVLLNKQPLFEYDDPEPLIGGHIAYWTVRSGFTVSRITSIAERLDRNPQVLSVPDDTAPMIWRPMQRDAVSLQRQEGAAHTRVTANVGAGFFAVRHTPPQPVVLTESPILDLPFELNSDTRVNLHLHVDSTTYILEMSAPLSDCKVLLGEEFEPRKKDYPGPMTIALFRRLEQFQLPTISENVMRSRRQLGTVVGGEHIRVNLLDLLRNRGHQGEFKLHSVTIGNSSNTQYLLAGNGGNHSGASYAMGTPKFLPAEK